MKGESSIKAHKDPNSIENQTARKRVLQKILHDYQTTFEKEHGRPIKSTADVGPLKNEYAEYKVTFTLPSCYGKGWQRTSMISEFSPN
jgi:hypothetical protein